MEGSLESRWLLQTFQALFALNINPLVLRFALRARSEKRRVKMEAESGHEQMQMVSGDEGVKVLLMGRTAGKDNANPEASLPPPKEIRFDSRRTFLTRWKFNFIGALTSFKLASRPCGSDVASRLILCRPSTLSFIRHKSNSWILDAVGEVSALSCKQFSALSWFVSPSSSQCLEMFDVLLY